jgi:nucleoside-diphosphate-sugar epimerase
MEVIESNLQIFGGSGFVGSAFVKKYPLCVVKQREDHVVDKEKDILYLISTVTNYNVKTNPYVDIETNLILLMKILSQFQGSNKTFNFISSWFVYGNTTMPATEESICNPTGFYSITKRCAEQLLISYCQTFNIKYRIIRLANVAGHGDNKASAQKNALQYMINQLKQNLDVNLYEGGNMYRDYIHVNDAVDAIDLIMSKGEINSIYNVGNGAPLLIKDLVEYAKMLIGGTGKINYIDVPQFHKIVQVHSQWMKNDKLKSLGYQPKYDMKSMIEDMIR